jgi:hypothetical protein
MPTLKQFDAEDKAIKFADKKKKAGLLITRNSYGKTFDVYSYKNHAEKKEYQTATIKDLKQLISTLSDDSKIMLAHSEMNGKPYFLRLGLLKVKRGKLVIEN